MKEFDYSDENIVKTINKNYFQRIKLLKKIIKKLSDDSSDIKSICINAPWGTGKTVFVHELKYLINNSQDLSKLDKGLDLSEIKVAKDIGCYYFNSWENDSINLPTLSLLYNILQDETWASAEFKNKIDNLKMNAANLLVRILSRGSLGFNELKVTEPSIFDEIFSSNKIKEEFNKTINEYLQINKLKKLVIILDELDRCKPDYAVNMLESIKHFYNNERLIFVISADLIQLGYTVKKFYGDGYDSDLYLQRFFDRIITLDKPKLKDYIYAELDTDLYDIQVKTDIINYCIKNLDMSTREINRFFALYNRICYALPDDFNNRKNMGLNLFTIYGIALKIKNTTLYTKYIKGEFSETYFQNHFSEDSSIIKDLDCHAMMGNSTLHQFFYEIYSELFNPKYPNRDQLEQYDIDKINALIKYEI